MAKTTYVETLDFVVETCCNCHVPFGILKSAYDHYNTTGVDFYCPNGHGQHYTESEVSKLKRKLAYAEKDALYYKQAKERTERSLSATRGVLTRTKNRIAKGICPCCHRQFVNLHRHMENQHPEFTNEQEEEE